VDSLLGTGQKRQAQRSERPITLDVPRHWHGWRCLRRQHRKPQKLAPDKKELATNWMLRRARLAPLSATTPVEL
jgi:hypothetical protein